MDEALLIARLVLGLGLAAHGAQKLFGWFGGYGIKGTGGFMETLGFRPGALFATAAGLGEVGGGLLTAAGFLGPLGPALVIVTMVVAIGAVHWRNGFFNQANGYELALVYAIGTFVLAFTGPGAYAVDPLVGIGPVSSTTTWLAVGAAVVLGLLNLAVRRPLPAASERPA
ncbi:MAG TPA: DoxX family protein [Thermodesulfobacteriota bacterium]